MAADRRFTIDDEVTDDAVAALKLLYTQSHIDARRMFVLGHSLGGMMAPRIAERTSQVAGVVMLAAPARPPLEVLAQQMREQGQRGGSSEAQIAASEHAIEAERALLAKAKPGQPLEGTFAYAPQSYWLSLRDYDAVAEARSLHVPLLIMQGAADFQVSPEADFARWQRELAGHVNATFHRYPGLNHLFMTASASGTARDYQTPGHVDAHVVRDIAAWIAAQPPGSADARRL